MWAIAQGMAKFVPGFEGETKRKGKKEKEWCEWNVPCVFPVPGTRATYLNSPVWHDLHPENPFNANMAGVFGVRGDACPAQLI